MQAWHFLHDLDGTPILGSFSSLQTSLSHSFSNFWTQYVYIVEPNDARSFTSKIDPVTGVDTFSGTQKWTLGSTINQTEPVNELLYGWGQYQNGLINYRDVPIRCMQYNTEACVPIFVSSQGYGVMWDSYGLNVWNNPQTQFQVTFSTKIFTYA